jgi:hypothetical protein
MKLVFTENIFHLLIVSLLAWYGHVIRRDESYITKRVMTMITDEHPRRGPPRWMDCAKNDMKIKGVSKEMTSDRRRKMLCRRHTVG